VVWVFAAGDGGEVCGDVCGDMLPLVMVVMVVTVVMVLRARGIEYVLEEGE